MLERFLLTTPPRHAAINVRSHNGRTSKHHSMKHTVLLTLGLGLALADAGLDLAMLGMAQPLVAADFALGRIL